MESSKLSSTSHDARLVACVCRESAATAELRDVELSLGRDVVLESRVQLLDLRRPSLEPLRAAREYLREDGLALLLCGN